MSGIDYPDWSPERSELHVLQGVVGPIEGWVEWATPGGEPTLSELIEVAVGGYCAAFERSELVEFDDRGSTYLFDTADDPAAGRTPRVVAAWGLSSTAAGPRQGSRQAGFPLSAALIAQGYERGHLLAHAIGGGLDENLFAQASHINQGRSPAGRAYRALERLATRHPGSLVFHRLIYGDGTDVPDLNQLTVGLPTSTHTGTFDNRPRPLPPNQLVRGQQFHRRVQTAFLRNLVGASGYPEHTLNLRTGARRVDLLIVPTTDEVTAVVVEVKNSDWDSFRATRVRPNLRRHIRQLQEYLDHYVDHLSPNPDPPAVDGLTWDSVIGVLLYPSRPRDSDRTHLIEAIALEQALTVVWYDESDWRD